jgi:hypothetical protein
MTRRHGIYFAVRGAAALLFVLAATVLPRGVPAGMLILLAGVVGLGSCLFANAGSPGEQAGARPQDRWFNSLRPPQGDWPPYESNAASTSVGVPTNATLRPPAAS